MSGILQELTQLRHADMVAVEASLATLPSGLGPANGAFSQALRAPGISVIAEVKRASPSRGDLAPIPDAAALAASYVQGGARAISVLTTPHGFKGSGDDLRAVAALGLAPALCKDFVTHPLHVRWAASLGASAILLIAAVFERRADLEFLLDVVKAEGLEALVEVHNAAELEMALAAGAGIVGVNHRNLVDFSMDMTLFERLRPSIPASVVAVAESGIKTAADVRRMVDAGADAVLIGEAVSAEERPDQKIAALLQGGRA